MRRTGHFECSDPLLNQLHHNVIWGLRGNFLDVPTDCPQRDERLGWTGDLAVFAPSAAYLYDVARLPPGLAASTSTAEQRRADGMVPLVVPDVLKYETQPSAFPTRGHHRDLERRGSVGALGAVAGVRRPRRPARPVRVHGRARAQVESMLSPTGLWDNGFQFGDWLDPDAPPGRALARPRPTAASWPPPACYRSRATVAETAHLLGRRRRRPTSPTLADRTRAAFNEHYVAGTGRSAATARRSYTLAIVFGLLDAVLEALAGERLAELVTEERLPDLHRLRRHAVHLRRPGPDRPPRRRLPRCCCSAECPSWLYPVTMGATTIWERWDSMLPDGTINPGEMTQLQPLRAGRRRGLDPPHRRPASRRSSPATPRSSSRRSRAAG